MDFFEKTVFSENDLRILMETQAEESTYLDFKAAGALEKTNEKRAEIAKDVSAFANSDGGVIVYGIKEDNHVASDFSFIDGNEYTKEWLERVINDGIQRRILGVQIFPIRVNGDIKQTVYVVKIPRSANAPHMCIKRHIYYRRYNFESVPMEEYEVRDLFHRKTIPNLEISGCSFYKAEETKDRITYELMANVVNIGHQACESFKLNYYINNYLYCDIGNEVSGEKLIYTALGEHRVKFSRPSKETLYPEEEINMGCLQFFVKKENVSKFLEGLVIDMILLYPGGSKDLAYIPSTREFISEREEINKLIEEKKMVMATK